ncbi:E3 ubiquitin-protein ligase CHFR-like isoform X2 [Crassostrea virginica]
MEGEAWGQLVSLTDVLSEPVLLTRERLTIGRAPDCDISFPGNKLVSGHHCTVEKDEGQVWLRDSSTNGTLLNLKVKVSKGNKKQLSHGDEFYVVHKKDNEELNIGYIYQNMEELKKEESQDATQEYSTEEYLDATLADEDVNDVEEDTRDDESKPVKRTFCRMSVDRISKNHIVNNLIEAYLKEHPGKKRSEEDIKDLDARNKISRDMLYPKELKGIEYDPDESVEDSDDYEEDSDEIVNEPPRPLTGPPVAYGGGLFGNWNPMRFVCRQCPNYQDPNTPGTGVLGTVFNTVRTALGINQGNNPPSTGGDEPGPSTDNPSEHDNQATQPTTSTDEPIPDFEERKKKDDMKPLVVAPQYACAVNQNHILCQCCLQPMPDRRTTAGIQQQCCLCLRVYCHAYWGCNKAQCLGCIGKFKDITLGRKCLTNLILENLFESEILKNYLEEKKMTLNEMRDVCMQKLDEGTYKCIDQNRARFSSESTVCYPCALRNFRDLAYAFRADIKKEDLPENVRRRNDCYWGKNCRTQRNKPHHAQNFNHICEQTRTS